MKITTPTGYIVTIQDSITFGERRQLEREAIKSAKINTTGTEFTGEMVYDMQDKAVELFVKQIEKDGKTITTGILNEILSWQDIDGIAVYDAINALTQPKKMDGGEK